MKHLHFSVKKTLDEKERLQTYLRIRDLGENQRQTLRQQQSPPDPQEELRWASRQFTDHPLPWFSLHPPYPLPPSSFGSLFFFLCLPPCLHWRRLQDRTTMALWMIDNGYDAKDHPQLFLLPSHNNTSGTKKHK